MRRVLAIPLALLMLAVLISGCGVEKGDRYDSSATPTIPSGAINDSRSSADSSGSGSDGGKYVYRPLYEPEIPAERLSDLQVTFDNIPTFETVDLPLSSESTAISAWIVFKSNDYASISDAPVDMELERRTNVHVTYQCATPSNAEETFNLMMAGGDYTDIIFGADYYIGGPDSAIANGVYLKLNDLISEYAPNYTIMRHLSEEHARGSITDSGNLYGFCDMLLTHENPWCGLVVRKDWLDDLGIKAPVTLSDWEKMMAAFIDRKGAYYGVSINPMSISFNNNDEFITSFDVNSEFYQVDGKVRFGPIEDGYLNYLTMARRWYEKGYIDPDFYRYSNYIEYLQGDAYTHLGDGHVGAAQSMGLSCGIQLYNNALTEDPNTNFVAVKNPVRNAGDTMHFRQLTSVIKRNGGGVTAAITTRAANPVLCTKWLDYRYTRSCARLLNYGVEGYNYVYDQGSQVITFTKDFANFDTGLENAYNYYIGQSMISMNATIYSTIRGSIHTGDAYQSNTDRWAEDGYDYVIPINASFASTEESTEFSGLYTDIQTYVNLMTIRFITGQEPLENFRQFVSRIKAMNIERCIELKQNGLEAYYNRPLD